jgi:hypothetical protein
MWGRLFASGYFLQLANFFEVSIWQVEEENANHNANDCRPQVAAPEEPDIKLIEYVPHAPPHQDNAEDDVEVFAEFVNGRVLHKGEREGEYIECTKKRSDMLANEA